ncbi:hypothetical protein SUGI_0550750 [Cryptomeria japonica]|nr:hypothetical protein SUGI_0550750 [Cryptomeria japonica]
MIKERKLNKSGRKLHEIEDEVRTFRYTISTEIWREYRKTPVFCVNNVDGENTEKPLYLSSDGDNTEKPAEFAECRMLGCRTSPSEDKSMIMVNV